MNVRENRRGNN